MVPIGPIALPPACLPGLRLPPTQFSGSDPTGRNSDLAAGRPLSERRRRAAGRPRREPSASGSRRCLRSGFSLPLVHPANRREPPPHVTRRTSRLPCRVRPVLRLHRATRLSPRPSDLATSLFTSVSSTPLASAGNYVAILLSKHAGDIIFRPCPHGAHDDHGAMAPTSRARKPTDAIGRDRLSWPAGQDRLLLMRSSRSPLPDAH